MELGIEKIVLVLENCEVIEIPGYWIADFFLDEIKEYVARIASNCIAKEKVANKVVISVGAGFNKVIDKIGDEERTIFDRIKIFNDITQIEVYYERKYIDDEYEVDRFLVDYDEEHEDCLGSPNVNQKTSIDDYGNLLITIGQDFEERHQAFLTESKEEKDFRLNMCDVGIFFEPAHKVVKADGTFDYPEDDYLVYVSNGEDYPTHKSDYAYRKNGEWIIKESDYHTEEERIKPDEVYSWARVQTCDDKYQKKED